MTDTTIKMVKDLLLSSKEMRFLCNNSSKVHDLNLLLRKQLPGALQPYCQIRQYRNSVLILEAGSGAAATQLRFLQTSLYNKLKMLPEFAALSTLEIKVGKPTPRLDRGYERTVRKASAANQSVLRETADSLTDQSLAEAMHNLANTLQNYGRK